MNFHYDLLLLKERIKCSKQIKKYSNEEHD